MTIKKRISQDGKYYKKVYETKHVCKICNEAMNTTEILFHQCKKENHEKI